jgi:pimeloyl-ACP methyl ester carboxylesterase
MTVRRHGAPPFGVAVLHGGPGAVGDAGDLAAALTSSRGVLEPLQSALSVEGQLEELRGQLEAHATTPVTLVGHSWGAMLAVLFAARHPDFVRKLVLIGCGPLEPGHEAALHEARMRRLTAADRRELDALYAKLSSGDRSSMDRFGEIFGKADQVDPLPRPKLGEFDAATFERVWPEAAALRARGGFLEAVRSIGCPVVAFHGDADPHPAEGVRRPLSVLPDFRFVLLERCGHMPWVERHAAQAFLEQLEVELR